MKLKIYVTSTTSCSPGYFVNGKSFSVREKNFHGIFCGRKKPFSVRKKNLSWDLSWSLSGHHCNVASALSDTMEVSRFMFSQKLGKNLTVLSSFSTFYLRKILTALKQTRLQKMPEMREDMVLKLQFVNRCQKNYQPTI